MKMWVSSDENEHSELHKDYIQKLAELTHLSAQDCKIFLKKCSKGSFADAVDKCLRDGFLAVIISVMAVQLEGATNFVEVFNPREALTAAYIRTVKVLIIMRRDQFQFR